jgi:hypothetical protein
MTADAMAVPGLEEAFLREYPLGRIGTSDDVANAALWLATDESFITGQVLQINGGLTLRRNPTQAEISASIAAAAARRPLKARYLHSLVLAKSGRWQKALVEFLTTCCVSSSRPSTMPATASGISRS